MNVIVTGSSLGFIGSNLAKRLINDGHFVYCTGQVSDACPGQYLGYHFHNIDWQSLPQIDIVFHQAAITDTLVHDREFMFEVNFDRSRALIEQAIKHGVKKIVYASSAAVYGDNMPPFREGDAYRCLNVYGESKLLLDRYCDIVSNSNRNVRIIGLRYSNVYGPGEYHKLHARSMVLQLLQQMSIGNPKLFEWGNQKRDFVYIDDVIQANIKAAQAEISGVFNVGSGISTSFNEIVSIINKILGYNREVEYIKNSISEFYQENTLLDLTNSRKYLEYKPEFNIETGIQDYILREGASVLNRSS